VQLNSHLPSKLEAAQKGPSSLEASALTDQSLVNLTSDKGDETLLKLILSP
jgi:hypothetical protein